MHIIKFVLNFLGLNASVKEQVNKSLLCWQLVDGMFDLLMQSLVSEEHVRFFVYG